METVINERFISQNLLVLPTSVLNWITLRYFSLLCLAVLKIRWSRQPSLLTVDKFLKRILSERRFPTAFSDLRDNEDKLFKRFGTSIRSIDELSARISDKRRICVYSYLPQKCVLLSANNVCGPHQQLRCRCGAKGNASTFRPSIAAGKCTVQPFIWTTALIMFINLLKICWNSFLQIA